MLLFFFYMVMLFAYKHLDTRDSIIIVLYFWFERLRNAETYWAVHIYSLGLKVSLSKTKKWLHVVF